MTCPPPSPVAEEAPDELVWTVHLAAEQPRKAAAAAFVCASVVGAATAVPGLPLLPFAAAFALLHALGDFFLPVTYRIGPSGAGARHLLRSEFISWDRVRHAYRTREGLKLGPLPHSHRLEPFRGVFLRVTEANASAAADLVRRYRAARGVSAEAAPSGAAGA